MNKEEVIQLAIAICEAVESRNCAALKAALQKSLEPAPAAAPQEAPKA